MGQPWRKARFLSGNRGRVSLGSDQHYKKKNSFQFLKLCQCGSTEIKTDQLDIQQSLAELKSVMRTSKALIHSDNLCGSDAGK